MKRVTKGAALATLIEEAGRSVAGSGVGIREALTEKRRDETARAMVRLWEEGYGYPPDRYSLARWGLHYPEGGA